MRLVGHSIYDEDDDDGDDGGGANNRAIYVWINGSSKRGNNDAAGTSAPLAGAVAVTAADDGVFGFLPLPLPFALAGIAVAVASSVAR